MTPDHDEHDRERGRAVYGDGDRSVDEPRDPGIDWSRVVATVLALIVVAIALVLLDASRGDAATSARTASEALD